MIVSVHSLTKQFEERRTWREMLRARGGAPKVTVVDNVSFEVGSGEVFGLLGQNGAGKTTIFKMLSTLILPDSGSARVGEADVVTNPREARRLLAPVIANERSLYWRLPARENLRLYAVLQGLSGDNVAREVARVTEIVGLHEAGEKMVGAFSSGMRQRLLIARALLGRPQVLLLDEPTRSLDPISARDFRAFLRDTVVRQEGCTVLLATHDAEEVWDLCDRVGVLEKGRLLEVDTTAALRHRTGGARYRAWVRAAHAEVAIATLGRAGARAPTRTAAVEAGWDEIDVDLPGDASAAARTLAALTGNAIDVARFERVAPSLADLIERVVSRRNGRPNA